MLPLGSLREFVRKGKTYENIYYYGNNLFAGTVGIGC